MFSNPHPWISSFVGTHDMTIQTSFVYFVCWLLVIMGTIAKFIHSSGMFFQRHSFGIEPVFKFIKASVSSSAITHYPEMFLPPCTFV